MLQKEFVNKLPAVPQIHRHIPNSGDGHRDQGSPKQAEDELSVRQPATEQIVKRDYREGKYYADQSFCEQSDADEKVKKE